MPSGLGSAIRDELVKLLEPLSCLGSVPGGTATLLRAVGHVGDLGLNPALAAEATRIANLATDIHSFDEASLGSWEGIARLLDWTRELMAAVRAVESALTDPGLAARAQNLGVELAENLLLLYLRAHHPHVFRAAAALTLIKPAEIADMEPLALENGAVQRLPWARERLYVDRILKLVENAPSVLAPEYLPGGMVNAGDAHQAAARLFPLLRDLARSLKLAWFEDLVRVTPEPLPPAPGPESVDGAGPWPPEDDMLEAPDLGTPDLPDLHRNYRPRLIVYVPGEADGAPAARFGIACIASAAEHPDGVRGLIVAPVGDVAWSEVRGNWRIGFVADGSVPAFVIGPDGLKPAPIGTPLTGVTAQLTAERIAAPDEPAFRFGALEGTRIEVGALRLLTKLALSPERQTLLVSIDAGNGALIVTSGEGDGFLDAILPRDGLRGDFNIGFGWSSATGFLVSGSTGLAASIPLHRSAGPFKLNAVHLGIAIGASGIAAEVSLSGSIALGAVTASVERIGTVASLDSRPGNLGAMDLRVGFKAPTGIGLSINGAGFKGGGFLSFEPDQKRYTGVLELEFQNSIALKAIGLLNTELPGGEPGYSLLLVISAEFQPVQLGLGFTLNGVGGLLGLNRTTRIERLRTGLRDNRLSNILFPTDVVAHADRIISDLREVFPPQADRFVFGPMAKIGWGSPTLMTIDLGLIIEVPAPMQLALLGVLRALVPDEHMKLLRLQVNFLGTVDFEKQQLAFDASLFDSKLLSYPLSGDMALRLAWGGNPNFLLSVGGFHPAYQPPPLGLPALRRLTLQLTAGNNPRLTLETYFAVTSNTVQFGAQVELYAAAGRFNVYGMLAFDALFQFNPFYFIADVAAKLALRVGSSSIASIKLSLTLEGPTPWKAKGTAKLKLCWFLTVKVRFTKTFGDARDTRLPDVAVLPLLQAALQNRQNWRARLPERSHVLVTVRELESAAPGIIAHPVGALEVSQKVVPLNVRIDRFGQQLPSDGREFRMSNVRAGGTPIAAPPVKEFFAPAQFFEKSDGQKLSEQSFARFDAGVGLSGVADLTTDRYALRDVEYELSYIDSQRDQLPTPTRVVPETVAFNAWTLSGAIAQSPLSFARGGKSALAPGAIRVAEERYGVVTTSDLTLVTPASVAASEAEAAALMTSLIAAEPTRAGQLQVIPLFETTQSTS